MERIKVSVDDGYAKWAPAYDAYANGLIMIEEPIVHDLLAKDGLSGRRVLDVACGTGRHTFFLAKNGAEVTGVDQSKAMLERARAKQAVEPGEGVSVRFLEGDVAKLPVADATFDIVLSGLVMEHVAEVRPALHEAARVLAPGGAFVLSVYHPAFLLQGVPPHFKDATGTVEYEMPAHVHLPSEYITVMLELGLRLTHFIEPTVGDELIAQKPNWEKHRGMPVAIILRAVKDR